MNRILSQIPDDLDPNDALLFGYAAGILDEALSLMAAVYTAVNEAAMENLQRFQAIGGALFEDLPPVAVSARCLNALLARLEEEEEACRKAEGCGCDVLPEALQAYTGASVEALNWKCMGSGIDIYRLAIARPATTRAELKRMHPGIQAPDHRHTGFEYTLVLDGAMIDCQSVLRRGDLVAHPKGHHHTPSSCPDKGCVALSVVEAATMPPILQRLIKGW